MIVSPHGAENRLKGFDSGRWAVLTDTPAFGAATQSIDDIGQGGNHQDE
ncbi:hypothetical protein [Sphingomonas sp. dw_22]|nr:hypothetical protein [Sphingomonas sp. dw_22]